jgi:hypothetical protein
MLIGLRFYEMRCRCEEQILEKGRNKIISREMAIFPV